MQPYNQKNSRLTKWVALVAIMLARLSHADQVAVGFDITHPWGLGGGKGVYGWQFTVNSDIQVLTLGVYDNANSYDGGFVGDGLMEPHIVSIWDVSQHSSPLVSAATPLGTAAPLLNGFRYVNASPVVLHPGHDYVLSATYPYDVGPYTIDKDLMVDGEYEPDFILTVGQGITFGGYRSVLSNTGLPVFPTLYLPGVLDAFGPNFTYIAVPEPTSFALCLIGAGMLLKLRAPKNRKLA
jgi:hypothetical protein